MAAEDAARALQARYYAETADQYDAMHGGHPEHRRALEIVSLFVQTSGASRVLDVGTGTGRGVRFLSDRHPNVEVVGIDPVPELLDVAAASGVSRSALALGSGEALPFPDRSFDVVCEFGVLHHVPDPAAVVREMQRVSRNAVFLSDTNRFGHGSVAARILKLALYKARLWWTLSRIRYRGHRYFLSEGDGVAYTYSVYDNLGEFADWDSVSLVPLEPPARGLATWAHPLLTTQHVLLCGFRRFPDSA